MAEPSLRELANIYYYAISGVWKTVGRDVQYRVERVNNITYIIFQATGSKSDIDTDIAFFPSVCNNKMCGIHGGFNRAFESAYPTILNEAYRVGLNKVVVYGYSMGAAYATLMHMHLKANSIDSSCIVFGSPRIFWFPGKIERELLSDVLRVEVYCDIVTCLPPAITGFRHIGYERKVGKKRLWFNPDYHRYPNYIVQLGPL
jgi:hypothetical protein